MEIMIHHPVFFTATINEWKKLLKPVKYKVIGLSQLKNLVVQDKIILYTYCIMDNHVHLIWQVKGENKPSEIQKRFLEGVSKEIKKDLLVSHIEVLKIFSSTQKDRSFHFWKRRPLSIALFSPKVFEQKLDYIHNNPVRAGICTLAEEYMYVASGWPLAQPQRAAFIQSCYVFSPTMATKIDIRG